MLEFRIYPFHLDFILLPSLEKIINWSSEVSSFLVCMIYPCDIAWIIVWRVLTLFSEMPSDWLDILIIGRKGPSTTGYSIRNPSRERTCGSLLVRQSLGSTPPLWCVHLPVEDGRSSGNHLHSLAWWDLEERDKKRNITSCQYVHGILILCHGPVVAVFHLWPFCFQGARTTWVREWNWLVRGKSKNWKTWTQSRNGKCVKSDDWKETGLGRISLPCDGKKKMHAFEECGSSQPWSVQYENVHSARAMAIPSIDVNAPGKDELCRTKWKGRFYHRRSRRRWRKENWKVQILPTVGLRDLCPVAQFVESKGTMLGHARILLQKNSVMKAYVRGAWNLGTMPRNAHRMLAASTLRLEICALRLNVTVAYLAHDLSQSFNYRHR